jgi:hypothetical protein
MEDLSGILDPAGSFDVQNAALARRRARVMALQGKNIIEPQMVSGHYINPGWLGALANALNTGIGEYKLANLDTEEKGLSDKIAKDREDWIAGMPKTIPAQQAKLGWTAGPVQDAGGDGRGEGAAFAEPGREPTPAVPAQPPSPESILEHASKGVRLGGIPAALATDIIKKQVVPGKEDYINAEGSIYKVGAGGLQHVVDSPMLKAKQDEVAQNHLARLQERRDALDAQSRQKDLDRVQAATLARERMENAKQIASMIHAIKTSGEGKAEFAGYSNDGNPVMRGKNNGVQVEVVTGADGTITNRPYSTAPTSVTAFEKEIPQVMQLQGHIAKADELLNIVNENKDAFGPTGQLSKLPLVGPAIRKASYTPEQLQAQATVGEAGSKLLLEISGKAVTKNEDNRNLWWMPAPDDPPELIASKLKGARDWANVDIKTHSLAAQKAAGTRVGGGTQPAPAAAAAAPAAAKKGITEAEYKALPIGAKYVGGDGVERTKTK